MGSGSSASKKWLSPFQAVKKWYTVHVDKNEISAFLTCKKLNKYGAEGGQGTIGKPLGRARRREIPCVCKHVMLNLQSNEAKTFVNDLNSLRKKSYFFLTSFKK